MEPELAESRSEPEATSGAGSKKGTRKAGPKSNNNEREAFPDQVNAEEQVPRLKSAIQTVKDRVLVEAAAEGNLEQVQRLIEQKEVPIDELHPELGYSAMHVAAGYGYDKVVSYLIEKGADLNVRRADSLETPLMFAASAGEIKCLEILLKAGCNKLLTTADDRTALMISIDMSKDECSMRLRDPPDKPSNLVIEVVSENSVICRWGNQPNNGSAVDFVELQWCWCSNRRTNDPTCPEPPFVSKEEADRLWPGFCDEHMNGDPLRLTHDTWQMAMGILNDPGNSHRPPNRSVNWKGLPQEEDPWMEERGFRDQRHAQKEDGRASEGWRSSGNIPQDPQWDRITNTSNDAAKLLIKQFGNDAANLDYDEETGQYKTPRTSLYDVMEGRDWTRFTVGEAQCDWMEGEFQKRYKGLEAANVYAIRLRAHNKAGYSVWSDEFRICMAPLEPGICSVPRLLSRSANAISLDWDIDIANGSAITEYELLACIVGKKEEMEDESEDEDEEEQWFPIGHDEGPITVPNAVCMSLQPGFSYIVKVRALSLVGWGPDSEARGDRSQIITTLDAPFPVGTSLDSISMEWIQILSTSGPPCSVYELQMIGIDIKPDPTGEAMDNFNIGYKDRKTVLRGMREETEKKAAPGELPKREGWVPLSNHIKKCAYTTSGLLPASGYMFVARGLDGDFGWTPWAEVPTSGVVYTDSTVPYTPFGLHKSGSTKTTVSVTWKTPRQNGSQIDYYELQWQCEEDWGEWQTVPAPVIQEKGYTETKDTVWGADAPTSFTLEDLYSGVRYAFCVKAHNKYGWSEQTDKEEMEWIRTQDDVPCVPDPPTIIEHGATFARVGWTNPRDNGKPIDKWEVQCMCENTQTGVLAYAGNQEEDAAKDVHWFTISDCVEGEEITVEGLVPVNTYYFVVRCHNAVGWSEWCARELAAKCLTDCAPPYPVWGVHCVGQGQSTLSFCWEEPYGCGLQIDWYEVSWCSAKDGVWHMEPKLVMVEREEEEKLVSTKVSRRRRDSDEAVVVKKKTKKDEKYIGRYQLTKLPPASGFCICIRAHNAYGYSMPTDNSASMFYFTKPNMPSMPLPPWLREQGSHVKGPILTRHLEICFSPPEDDGGVPIDQYHWQFQRRVYAYVDGHIGEMDEYLELPDVLNTELVHCYTGLPPGIMHRVRVRARNACGWTNFTDWVMIRTEGCPPDAPIPITACKAGRFPWGSGLQIYVEWTEPKSNGHDIDAYELQIRKKNKLQWDVVRNDFTSACGTACSYEGKVLEASTTYEFRVRAHNFKGWGPWTSEGEEKLSSVRTLCTPPLKPKPPVLKAFTTSSLTIRWEPPEEGGKQVFNYHLQCRSTQERGAHIQEWGLLPNRSEWYTLDPKLGTKTELIIRDLCFEKYVFRIRAQNDLGWSFFSDASDKMRTERRL
jgi:hypothetical protein